MSRISFEKKDRQLTLCYETESDWLEEKLEEDQDFQIYKTFSFSKKDLIFEAIKTECRRYGVNVIGSEVVGLVPMKALIDCAEYYLQIENFSSDQVLEGRLL